MGAVPNLRPIIAVFWGSGCNKNPPSTLVAKICVAEAAPRRLVLASVSRQLELKVFEVWGFRV